MDLAAVVKKYLEVAGGFDRPVHLSRLGLSKSETEKVISTFDEDYQISRYMLLSLERDEETQSLPSETRAYLVNGFEVSHISFRPEIQKLL